MVRCKISTLCLIAVFIPQLCLAFDWCGTSRIEPGAVRVNYMIVNGLIRSYGLYVPKNLRPQSALVLDFHGFGANRIIEEQSSCWRELAEEEGAVVVYPQSNGVLPSWSAGDYCCDLSGPNDADFSLQIVKCLTNSNSRTKGIFIDEKRVYATGLSNGGAMAGRLACDHSDVFSGALVISQSFPYQSVAQCRSVDKPQEKRPAIPIIEARGTLDIIVPYSFSWGWSVPAAESSRRWGQAMACESEPRIEDICDRPGSGADCEYGRTQCKTYYDCEGGAIASQCTLIDGHLLYGNSHDFNVCKEAWFEFERFQLNKQ